MHKDILPSVIFSPATLAISLAEGLMSLDVSVTLFSPGPINTEVHNINADLSYFERELKLRGDSYVDLLKKHPFTFITLARQVQSELVAKAYEMANKGEFDLIHIYTNEEEIALPFASLCRKPVVFTHHDPFNFQIRYKSVFPKYRELNWLSMSYQQRQSMPHDTNWVGNVYHGLPAGEDFTPVTKPTDDYFAYIGRIIEPKGVHLAIQAVKQYNKSSGHKLSLKIAGKHYSGHKKDTYWQTSIKPEIDDLEIEYVGFIDSNIKKRNFLANAKALIVPSIFDEPFGIVIAEALACGTPIVALNSGAIPEIIKDHRTGIIVNKKTQQDGTIDGLATASDIAKALKEVGTIERKSCRQDYEKRFTIKRMCLEHKAVYESLTQLPNQS